MFIEGVSNGHFGEPLLFHSLAFLASPLICLTCMTPVLVSACM